MLNWTDNSAHIAILDFNFYLPTLLRMVSTKNTIAFYTGEKLRLQGCSSQLSEI